MSAAAGARGAGGDPSGTVLVVDDEPLVLRMVERLLSAAGFRTHVAASTTEALEALRVHGDEIDVVLTDLNLDDGSGMDVLASARIDAPAAVVVIMTAQGTIASAVEAMRDGAYDFLVSRSNRRKPSSARSNARSSGRD